MEPTIDPTEEMIDDDGRAELLEQLDVLKAEFGDEQVSELMVDVHLDETIAGYLLDAEGPIREASKALNGKARFVMHREPNGDLYVLRNLKPSEWNTQWLQILTGDESAFNRYKDPILTLTMVYPAFEQTDWDYEGEGKMHAPLGLTKSRLVGAFLEAELPDPNQPSSVAFDSGQIENATKVARRHKPSL